MLDTQNLLVVDDEEVICQACQRVFSRQGFQVEECVDPREGLNRATEKEYSAILLDIKMPGMDGIQFLEELRKKKPDVPVMIMTGYPSIPNAASAVRLGASDYITKPFTPEQITQAVQRMLAHRDSNGKNRPGSTSATVESEAPPTREFLFLNEAWCQLEEDGSACVGAMLPRSQGATVQALQLPKVGEVMYQGLPLAGITMEGKSQRIVPSPVSGVVVAVNEQLTKDPSVMLNDPAGDGWIACICTTRLDAELDRCKFRRVILTNADETSARNQQQRLDALGCQVRVVASWEELAPAVRDSDNAVVVFDAASLGGAGPELVRQVNAEAPSVKIVVIAAPTQWEAAYREHRIFYYAVEPFADNEIAEILNSAFRQPAEPFPQAERGEPFPQPLSGIRITNHNGRKVQLLAGPGLLRRSQGLGARIRWNLDKHAFPIVTIPGDREITPSGVLKAANGCDRVMVLLAGDTGRLPGSLARDTRAEYVSASRENTGKTTTLVVQPAPGSTNLEGLSDLTTAALAEHIVQEMASY